MNLFHSFFAILIKGITTLQLLFWIILLPAHAQTSSISGKVTDKEGKAIEFCNVLLFSLPDSARVAFKTSDSLGSYTFAGIRPGEYIIRANMFGYKDGITERITISGASDIAVKDLIMVELTTDLSEVVIDARKSLVRVEADKMVVDIENGVANSGLTAVDVLRRSPGISVDKDGKIELRGKKGVLVMLDDRPLYMGEEQVANLLRSIPSDQIKEVEIITSPSAKYDAVGNAGIINIRLKKGAYEGLNGSINGSLGKGVYHKASMGVNVVYKKKKISFNTGCQYNNREGLTKSYFNRSFSDPSIAYSGMNSDVGYSLPENSHSFNFSGQYTLSAKRTISFDLNNNYSQFFWKGHTASARYLPGNMVADSYQSTDEGSNRQMFFSTGAGFQQKLDTNGGSLSLGLNYNKNYPGVNKDFTISYFDASGNITSQSFIFNQKELGYNTNFSANADLSKRIYKKIKLETGLKLNGVINNRPADIIITEDGVARDASNHFLYKENIYAAYAMLNKTISRWKLQGGLRLEHTDVEGTISLIDSTFTRHYTNLFPSGGITFNVTPKTSYSIQYSRRIQRPNAQQLNPILSILDPFTAWGGDPYMLPQYSNNIDLVYSILSGYIVTTAGYAYMTRPIVWVSRLDPVSLKTIGTQVNLKSQISYNFSVAVNMPLTKWWSTSNYVLLFYNRYTGNLGYGEVSNGQTAWQVNSTQTFSLPAKFTLELSGVYEPPSAYALSRSFTRWQVNAGLQKKLWDNRATAKIAISDIFFSFQYGGTTILGSNSISTGYRWDNRVLTFTFSYKFGKRLMWDNR